MKVFILVVLSICVNKSVTEVCGNFKTCGACIGFPRDTCVWCSQPNITERCQPKNLMQKYWCEKKYLYDPKSDSFQLIKDVPFRPAEQNLSAVQFKPQHLTVKLRPGHEQSFSMSFKHAADFPLDVYYLMDYSYTMNKHVDELKKQSETLKSDLTDFTNNVYFGLGSFIEKPSYPFAGKIHNTYAFRNHLNLTSDIHLFDKILSEPRNFSNFDVPEAGLDALMQVMACEKEIGWRANVKRIIVLCTDATYHSAGDGKFVLAYKPNDMECHLNASHYYDYSLIQDYPSVSQINKIATDGKFKIIFATLNSVDNIYKQLSYAIFGAESAVLSKTSNIFDIIKNVYLKSIRYVAIKYQFPPFVELKLSPNCNGAERTECEVGHKEVFNMNATLKVTSCPEIGNYKHSLLVGPVDGGLQDKLKIDLEIVDCQCECEKDKYGEPNSPKCSKSGTLQCGICSCNLDRSGDTCECDGSDTSKINLDKCKNGNDTRFCSGKGNCKCGKCTCFTGFSGDFCEFDDNSCRRRDNKLCSGNGKCTRGQCQCDTAHWTGEDCGCSTHNQNCYAPHSEEICSGKGECVCNECVCGKLEGKTERYSGVFCEDCEECAEKRCKELEGYALCNYLSNKTYCDEQYNQTSNTDVQMLNKSEINTSKWPTAKWCRAKLDKDRSIVFIHVYDKSAKKLLLIIQTDAEEDPKANIWIPVGIAIATVVIIGLLTVLVWKLLVDAMDEREYNKFMEQAKSEGFDTSENPIYQPASVNFANPTYNVMDNTLIENRH